jgi:hypothetical protein
MYIPRNTENERMSIKLLRTHDKKDNIVNSTQDIRLQTSQIRDDLQRDGKISGMTMDNSVRIIYNYTRLM